MSEVLLRKEPAKERTEEVADIIERMPSRFGIWVTAIVLLLVLAMVVFGWIIKYPDVLRGPITISSRQAPVKLVTSNAGRLHLLTANGASVMASQYIAVITNPAHTADVQLVDTLLKKVNIHQLDYVRHRKFFPENIALGELNNSYFTFLNALYQYLDYYREKPFDKQKDILEKLSSTQRKTLQEVIDQYGRLRNKYQLAKSLFERDSGLFVQNAISAQDLERSRISLLNTEQEFKTINIEVSSGQYQVEDVNNKLQQLVIQRLEKNRQLEIDLLNSYYELQENIRQWEHKYVFVAPFTGKVDFLNFWKDGDFIQPGQELFSIVPAENDIMGQAFLPEQGAGQVAKGQEVIIKLDNYPYTQYGSVKGKVKNISLVTNQQALSTNQSKVSTYLVTIELSNGLKTNYGSLLNFQFEAKGTAEIITNDRRLIDRLFDNLKHKVKQ